MWQYLTLLDFLLAPVFILVLSVFARKVRDKKYPKGHPYHPYYLPGLYLKFVGAIFIALLYAYYYVGGDTYNFFNQARIINSADFDTWWKLILHTSPEVDPKLYAYTSQLEWYDDASSYMVVRIAAVLGLTCGTHYLPIALLFAYFSFQGIWAMFRTFAGLYPAITKELAISFLFIPSVLIWGSSIFKDTVCMFGLGWLTYTTFRLFINRDFSIKNFLFVGMSLYLIATIKVYILMGFIPGLMAWVLLTYSKKIGSIGLKWAVNLLFIGVSVGAFLFFSQKFANELNKYSLDNLAKTASITRGWISYMSEVDQGSGYDLGTFEPTITGMLTKFPQAVVVTLFRPFPWESRKIIVFLSALEALAMVYFTFQAFRKRGAIRFIFKDPNVLFCLIFALIFAFAVGISSYNFGALSRYKIPCMPFYAAFLMILIHHRKTYTAEKQLVREKNEAELASIPAV